MKGDARKLESAIEEAKRSARQMRLLRGEGTGRETEERTEPKIRNEGGREKTKARGMG